MAKFARYCIYCMAKLTQQLKLKLSPDIGDLSLHVGFYNGPDLAGVLQNTKLCFQLFSNTMNTAS